MPCNRFMPRLSYFNHNTHHRKWVETSFPSCSITLVNLENFCHLLKGQRVKRIFFIGDSLQFQMAQSLWKLLDQLGEFGMDKGHDVVHEITCPDMDKFAFTFQFARNDRLLEVETGPATATDKNCKCGYCWPWTRKYVDDSAKTIFVANTGAHSHKRHIFEQDFDAFVAQMDALRRPGDLVYFRTSSPGHLRESFCEHRNVANLSSSPRLRCGRSLSL